MAILEPLSEIIPYSLYRQRTPPEAADVYRFFTGIIGDVATRLAPPSLSDLVLLPTTRWQRPSDALELYAFGQFPDWSAAVLVVAEIAVPAYQEFAILPLVHPIHLPDWREVGDPKSRTYRRIARLGWLAYSQEWV